MVGITAKLVAAEIRRQRDLSLSIADDQTKISTGIALTTPSQDPLAWVQVSDIGRAQAQQSAWATNVSYGQSRAAKAESNLGQIYTLFTRAQELMVSSSTAVLDDSGRTAIVEELKNLRLTMADLLNEKDYQGTPVFDDGASTLVPVSRGLNLPVVGTRQSISEGINVGGTTLSLDDMVGNAISAIQSGDSAAMSTALTQVRGGLDHIIVQQSVQGVRGDRLDTAGERLTEVDLNLTERRSSLESTDLTTTLATVKAKLLSLEAAQSAYARINQQTLFDLIN
ncbi:flagellin [Sphingobium aquiterrae]|uniref:flagellin n=1 Tax=Sphingobium aquiterrae TaxID=2038656 RepID=UPI003016D217